MSSRSDAPHILSRVLDELQDRERSRVQQSAGLGRLNSAGMANEQCDAKILFELANLHTERRLCDVKLFGCARHVAGIYHIRRTT